ncbi:unnamed protein product [Discosporangium mesarthrocarpum]
MTLAKLCFAGVLISVAWRVEGATSPVDKFIFRFAGANKPPERTPIDHCLITPQNDTGGVAVEGWRVEERDGAPLASVDFQVETTSKGWYRRDWTSTVPVNRRGVTPGEGMTRYPSLETPGGLLRSLDYLGTASFAFSGAITAGVRGMNLMGCVMVAVITAIGGGTTRDVLMGQTPVFWMEEVEYLGICVVTALAAVYLWPFLSRFALVSSPGGRMADGDFSRLLDTIGLGAFSVVGSQHGIRKGFHPFLTIVIAVITCCGGGIIRDVLTKAPVAVMQGNAELYASAAALGSSLYLWARHQWDDPLIRLIMGISTTMLMRVLSWTYGLKLPHAL